MTFPGPPSQSVAAMQVHTEQSRFDGVKRTQGSFAVVGCGCQGSTGGWVVPAEAGVRHPRGSVHLDQPGPAGCSRSVLGATSYF